MATKNMGYDHPTYLTRTGEAMGEVGGAATTQYAKFAAFTAKQAYSAQMTVTVAGTAAGHSVSVQKISGTATTALGTQTIGTAAAGTTFNLALSATPGGVALNQGDMLVALTGVDATGKVALTYEEATLPLSNVTA